MLTSDPKVVEGQDKAYYVYLDGLSNFIGRTLFSRPLVFEIIEIIG